MTRVGGGLFFGGLLVALGAAAVSADDPPALESRLMPLIKAHKGDVAVAVKNLKTGESWSFRADEPMPTASLCKLPVMMEAYRQAAEKQVDLNRLIALKKSDKVPGSGILTDHFSEGAQISLRDAIHLMIAFSDNTATNLVLDQIGIPSTSATMEKWGYPESKIHSKVYRRDTSAFPERSKRFGLGSTTAGEMIRLCEAIHKKELVSPEACAEMRAHLEACDDKDKFRRFLPRGTKIAYKTGTVDDIRTAAGIIETPGGPVTLCVLTEHNADRRYDPENAGDRLCAEVAREVYQHFGEAKPRE